MRFLWTVTGKAYFVVVTFVHMYAVSTGHYVEKKTGKLSRKSIAAYVCKGFAEHML